MQMLNLILLTSLLCTEKPFNRAGNSLVTARFMYIQETCQYIVK